MIGHVAMSRVSDVLDELLVTEFKVAPEALAPEATLEDLALDSLGLAELVDLLQTEFGVTLGDGELALRSTLGQAVEVLEAKVRGLGTA